MYSIALTLSSLSISILSLTYFAAYENHYPVLGVVLIPFGKVTARLKSIEELKKEDL